jgi:hypothetical protein
MMMHRPVTAGSSVVLSLQGTVASHWSLPVVCGSLSLLMTTLYCTLLSTADHRYLAIGERCTNGASMVHIHDLKDLRMKRVKALVGVTQSPDRSLPQMLCEKHRSTHASATCVHACVPLPPSLPPPPPHTHLSDGARPISHRHLGDLCVLLGRLKVHRVPPG